MRGKEEEVKINGVWVEFTYHEDYLMGELQGFWRADTSNDTLGWDRSKTELKKEVRRKLKNR